MINFKETVVKKQWGGRDLSISSGHIGRQADGSVVVRYGDTMVHAAVCAVKKADVTGDDFLPLTVIYQEKYYSVGKIPGGYLRREGKQSDFEVLTSRLIDRPIRPLFAEGFVNETQVVCTTLSYDPDCAAEIVALIAASAALTISGLPFLGPIAAARVGYADGQYVLNPTVQQAEKSELDLVVAGTNEGVLMVESEAKELGEDVMLGAVDFGHKQMQPVIEMIMDLAEQAAKDPWEVPSFGEGKTTAETKMKALRDDIASAYKITDKMERHKALGLLKDKAAEIIGDDQEAKIFIPMVFQAIESDVVRNAILDTGRRIDGRDTKTVRPILCEPGILPKAHGSVLFTRGETQALVAATLGTGTDEQRVETLGGDTTVNFMLHYNFLPFSVGEVKRIGSPGRREIGHGKLAWRAIHPMLPTEYPYTLRVVSEIMESNGSSSMATVCGTSLALMDAGVPIKKPVAGIAMGLIKEGERFSVLTDILGDEDHLGDMDFKVAGTADGVTALQMDIKITSITREIMDIALKQAKEGRMHILGEMAKALSAPRDELSPNAPRITTMQIDKDKIREVIGTGGKVIREIVEVSGAKIDVDDNGFIKIFATSGESCQKAQQMINDILAVAEPGKIYRGKVVKLMEFGVFVNFIGNSDGLVHISELSTSRVENAEAVVSEGDEVWVKCLDVDPRGKVRLSMKRVDQSTGQDLDPNNEIEVVKPKPRERSRDRDRGDRDRRPRRREE